VSIHGWLVTHRFVHLGMCSLIIFVKW
jgi:hypothetical protein